MLGVFLISLSLLLFSSLEIFAMSALKPLCYNFWTLINSIHCMFGGIILFCFWFCLFCCLSHILLLKLKFSHFREYIILTLDNYPVMPWGLFVLWFSSLLVQWHDWTIGVRYIVSSMWRIWCHTREVAPWSCSQAQWSGSGFNKPLFSCLYLLSFLPLLCHMQL
jgi:hypothetical protein